MRLDLRTFSGQRIALVHCIGDIIYSDEAEFFHDTVRRLPQAMVLLDMERVRTVDACGLGRIASLLKQHRSSRTNLVLLNPRPDLRELLRLTRLDVRTSPANRRAPVTQILRIAA
jgi:anti-anti-sigma factor